MSSEQNRKNNSDEERTGATELATDMKAGGEKQISAEERSEREATFTRRALLQWSVPVILAITLPQGAHAQASPHSDAGHSDAGHTDAGHTDAGHTDAHTDGHTDFTTPHTDVHGDLGTALHVDTPASHGDSHSDNHTDVIG
jgi:hypothetical protein